MNEASARTAFEMVRPTLLTLTREELLPIRIDVQLAAAVAHSVGVRDAAPSRRARFQALTKSGVIDLADIDRLPEAALAVWYTRQQQQQIDALRSEAMVPAATVKDAQTVRGRMLRVLEHYFDDDADVAPRLAVIRAGSGLQDVANDLEQLADLYEEEDVHAVVSKDPKHWQNDDPERARGLAQSIFRGLGLETRSGAEEWAELAQRAWTHLFNTYQEVRAAGQFVFRKDEDVELTYPSLVTAVRSPAVRQKEDPAAEAPPAPVTPPPETPPPETPPPA